jgi:hypothetical protein
LFVYLVYITLVCFNQFQLPRKKLDGAIAIPFILENISNYEHIEEEILSRIHSHQLPPSWKRIQIGLICYQISLTAKADHYDLRSDGAIAAFKTEVKRRKNIQLCIYQEKSEKRKEITYGSAVENSEINSHKKILILL